MRKFFIVFFIASLFITSESFAKEPLRTEDAIFVETGKVVQSGIVADSNGLLFIEFSQNARIVITADKLSFSGKIMPPQLIALPDKKPRARMQEVITFELLGDTAEQLTFADQFDLMSGRSRLRYELLHPESFSRKTALVQILVPITEDYGELSLWEYSDSDGWIERGGKIEDSISSDTKVFSSVLTGTGVFTLFDNNPSPDFVPPFPLDKISLVEPDPFADEYFTENAAYSTESTPELFDGNYVDPQLPIDPISIEGTSPVSLNTTNSPDRAQTFQELYAQKDAEGKLAAMPLLLDGIRPDKKGTVTEVLAPSPLISEEEYVPIPDELPQTGPEAEERQRTIFPFMILFAVVILGSSFYFAVKGRSRMRG